MEGGFGSQQSGGGDDMNRPDEQDREMVELRERLARPGETSIRITESLDFDKVLLVVVDSVRVLTSSRYGATAVPGESELMPILVNSGLTPEQSHGQANVRRQHGETDREDRYHDGRVSDRLTTFPARSLSGMAI